MAAPRPLPSCHAWWPEFEFALALLRLLVDLLLGYPFLLLLCLVTNLKLVPQQLVRSEMQFVKTDFGPQSTWLSLDVHVIQFLLVCSPSQRRGRMIKVFARFDLD